MRQWKDRVNYKYPNCLTITLQSAGRSYRLKLEIRDIGTHSRYDKDGRSILCTFEPYNGFVYILNVLPKPRLVIRKQLYNLHYSDGMVVFDMIGKGADLLEIAKFCEMTPIGPVKKLFLNREINNGQDCDAQTPARVEAGGQAQAGQTRQVDGTERQAETGAVREQELAPPAVQPASSGADYVCPIRCSYRPCTTCEAPDAPRCSDARCQLCSVSSSPSSPTFTMAS